MGKALHEQAAEYIRARILSGEYAVGSQIPTENELCALLGVSRPTLRQALDTLTREGLIVRIKGKGTFAAEPKVVHESTRFVTGYRAESEKTIAPCAPGYSISGRSGPPSRWPTPWSCPWAPG